ncbi:MAG: YafY family transcriptional regulator, partial [Clostridia bacterium]
KGKGGGISLLPNFVLNKAVLTEGEKSDILAALHAVDAVSLEQANTAVQKLSSLFGGPSADWVEVDFSDWVNGDEEAELFFRAESRHSGQKAGDVLLSRQ